MACNCFDGIFIKKIIQTIHDGAAKEWSIKYQSMGQSVLLSSSLSGCWMSFVTAILHISHFVVELNSCRLTSFHLQI